MLTAVLAESGGKISVMRGKGVAVLELLSVEVWAAVAEGVVRLVPGVTHCEPD